MRNTNADFPNLILENNFQSGVSRDNESTGFIIESVVGLCSFDCVFIDNDLAVIHSNQQGNKRRVGEVCKSVQIISFLPMPRILGGSKNDSQICGGRGDWI